MGYVGTKIYVCKCVCAFHGPRRTIPGYTLCMWVCVCVVDCTALLVCPVYNHSRCCCCCCTRQVAWMARGPFGRQTRMLLLILLLCTHAHSAMNTHSVNICGTLFGCASRAMSRATVMCLGSPGLWTSETAPPPNATMICEVNDGGLRAWMFYVRSSSVVSVVLLGVSEFDFIWNGSSSCLVCLVSVSLFLFT